MLLVVFGGVMATVTADTWATEIGVLSPQPPRLLTTWRCVEPGTSGGITSYGMLASAGGALAIGVALAGLAMLELEVWLPGLLAAAWLGGLVGSLSDSLLGATVQAIYIAPGGETERSVGSNGAANQRLRGWSWMNNDIVNFLSSLVGGVVALAVFVLSSS